jgi:Nuclease-related domain
MPRYAAEARRPVTSQLNEALRARQLASDRRAGSWARGQAWTRQLAFIRSHWRRLGGALLLSLLVAVPGVAMVPGGFGRGFVAGGLLVAIIATLWAHVVRATGTGQVMMGDLAEQWTASDLRRLRAQGWRLVNGVRLGVEIDHVLIGPGGTIAVESKWSGSSWATSIGRARVVSAIEQVRRGARQLRLLNDLRRCGIEQVGTVVVLWGSEAADLTMAGDRADATAVIAGSEIGEWAGRLPTGVLTQEQIQNAWDVLDARCRKTDGWSAGQAVPPPSLTRVVIIASATVTSALTAVVVAADCLGSWNRLGWWTLALLVPSLALGPAFDRLGRLRAVRPIVWGWTLGVAVSLPLWAFAILYEVAR